MTYKNLTFYNHNYQGCLCKTITSKRIELERRGWSGLVGLEILFPTVICDGAKTGYEPRNSRDKNFTTANNVLMFSQPQLRFLKSNSEKINTKSPSA